MHNLEIPFSSFRPRFWLFFCCDDFAIPNAVWLSTSLSLFKRWLTAFKTYSLSLTKFNKIILSRLLFRCFSMMGLDQADIAFDFFTLSPWQICHFLSLFSSCSKFVGSIWTQFQFGLWDRDSHRHYVYESKSMTISTLLSFLPLSFAIGKTSALS